MRGLTQSQWQREKVSRMPPAVADLVEDHHAAFVMEAWRSPDAKSSSPWAAANRWLTSQTRELKAAHIGQAFDEQAIRDHAENYATLCARMHSLEARQSFANYIHVAPPAGRQISRDGAIKRLDDPLWWRRQLRKVWTRAAENAMRDLGMIRKGRAAYASDEAVRHRAAQQRRMREYLDGHVAVNELGEQLSLIAAAEKSIANPAIRRGEFMTRVRGFEEIAQDLGHVAEFVTLTAPSFFHAQLASGGRNPAFERAIVRDAQSWLCRQWAKARAKLKRLSILVYGFRIAEPHHDATPHWHCLLFVATRHVDTLRRVLSAIWLGEFGDEAGARAHRVKFETVDPKKGSAAGYVAKYVSKNIDGEGAIGNDSDRETESTINSGIARVAAWASIHGIRQFQQIGGPPVGLWREARRLRDRVQDSDLERARDCADRGDWRQFVRCIGGIHAGRRTNLRLERADTGATNRYGEARPPATVGIRYASAVAITRPHSWRIERKGAPCSSANPLRVAVTSLRGSGRSSSRSSSSLGPVAITVRGAPNYNEPSTWSNPQETSQAGPQ